MKRLESLETRGARETRVDGMLDLQHVPAAERWPRITEAIRRLGEERGPHWRLKLLLRDDPEAAHHMPALIARVGRAGLHYDTTREPGGVQGTVLSPRRQGDVHELPVAA